MSLKGVKKLKPTRITLGEQIKRLHNKYNYIVVNTDSKCTSLEDFSSINSKREITVGIAEQNAIAIAAGIASFNQKVIVSMFSVFISLRALEQLRTFICYPNLNVTILATHTGLQVGQDGATHAAIEDISIIRSIPNIAIIQPCDSISAKHMADFVLSYNGPLYVRLHRNTSNQIHDEKYRFKFGVPDKIVRYGNDLLILNTGILLDSVIEASKMLLNIGYKVTVVDYKTIKPINKKILLDLVEGFPMLITVEDHTIMGGFGSSIAELLTERRDLKMKILGIQDRFSSSGEPKELYKEHHLDAQGIFKESFDLLERV